MTMFIGRFDESMGPGIERSVVECVRCCAALRSPPISKRRSTGRTPRRFARLDRFTERRKKSPSARPTLSLPAFGAAVSLLLLAFVLAGQAEEPIRLHPD